MIPVWYSEEGEPRFGLLCEDRHPIRQEKNITFPRGHLSPGISDEANAVKELCEEMGVDPADIAEIRYLGISHPDSGLTGSSVHFYEISLSGCKCPTGNIGHEGIRSVQWVSEDTLREMFSDGRITCGFAYTAYLKHLLPKD